MVSDKLLFFPRAGQNAISHQQTSCQLLPGVVDSREMMRLPDPQCVRSPGNRDDLATSWDDLRISAEKRLPQQFALAPDRVEAFNREQMGQIYADFRSAEQSNEMPRLFQRAD